MTSSSQVSSIYSIQQECASLGSNISNTNDIDNGSVNYNISNVNEQQNIEFEDHEKLEIVPSLESMYIQYNNWFSAHIKPTNITASAQLLPEVDK
ncbi:24614_t:CDS:2 [Cetraspora pellucida]|uniref:24614_t:CDS:1 n=1 Tax=Cetraspora pellucida TaxID=1433469 RepID=A0A9N9NEL7_9GLOM|nr:24614_t:CDS:2 [Cetraspora pellucida]